MHPTFGDNLDVGAGDARKRGLHRPNRSIMRRPCNNSIAFGRLSFHVLALMRPQIEDQKL
jgi:hypothetical protein